MQTPPEALLIHIRIAAERLGLSQYQVRNLVKSGTLPHERLGNRTYIPAAALDEYVANIGQSA